MGEAPQFPELINCPVVSLNYDFLFLPAHVTWHYSLERFVFPGDSRRNNIFFRLIRNLQFRFIEARSGK